MSVRIGDIGVIEPEPDRVCTLCGNYTETRPYGPGGSRICFECANATPEMKALARHNMGIQLFGEEGELE